MANRFTWKLATNSVLSLGVFLWCSSFGTVINKSSEKAIAVDPPVNQQILSKNSESKLPPATNPSNRQKQPKQSKKNPLYKPLPTAGRYLQQFLLKNPGNKQPPAVNRANLKNPSNQALPASNRANLTNSNNQALPPLNPVNSTNSNNQPFPFLNPATATNSNNQALPTPNSDNSTNPSNQPFPFLNPANLTNSNNQAIPPLNPDNSTNPSNQPLPPLNPDNSTNPSNQPLPPLNPPNAVPELTPPIRNITEEIRLVVKLRSRRVVVYRGKKVLASYPIAVGKPGWETPLGEFQVLNMEKNPIFKSFKTGRIIHPGPENPLGPRWIGIWTDGKTQLGFHGTNQEQLIGKAVSHGCIRMRNRDVLKLYEKVRIGTLVVVEP